MTERENLPIAVIGAGPVGLAAAAHLVSRGLVPLVFERGASVGGAMGAWSHVRVFSPWLYNIDAAARNLVYTAPVWPAGTVFISVVDPGVGTKRKSVVVKTKNGQFFVGPDNGSFGYVAQEFGEGARP